MPRSHVPPGWRIASVRMEEHTLLPGARRVGLSLPSGVGPLPLKYRPAEPIALRSAYTLLFVAPTAIMFLAWARAEIVPSEGPEFPAANRIRNVRLLQTNASIIWDALTYSYGGPPQLFVWMWEPRVRAGPNMSNRFGDGNTLDPPRFAMSSTMSLARKAWPSTLLYVP